MVHQMHCINLLTHSLWQNCREHAVYWPQHKTATLHHISTAPLVIALWHQN